MQWIMFLPHSLNYLGKKGRNKLIVEQINFIKETKIKYKIYNEKITIGNIN